MVICTAVLRPTDITCPSRGTPVRCFEEVGVFSLRHVSSVRQIRSIRCRQNLFTSSSTHKNSLWHTFGAYNGKLVPLREYFHSCASLVPRSVASPPHHNHISVHFCNCRRLRHIFHYSSPPFIHTSTVALRFFSSRILLSKNVCYVSLRYAVAEIQRSPVAH